MWIHYELAPWTRDGRVRADVVAVAPDVTGFVMSVAVVDNQVVRKGDPLFQLDRARYEIALRQALAAVARERAVLAEARREAHRNDTLGDVVAFEVRQQSQARVEEAAAILQQGLADVAAAQLNLQRTLVLAPVNGVVTNLELRPGDYFIPGRQALALVDADSVYVDGYFEKPSCRTFTWVIGSPCDSWESPDCFTVGCRVWRPRSTIENGPQPAISSPTSIQLSTGYGSRSGYPFGLCSTRARRRTPHRRAHGNGRRPVVRVGQGSGPVSASRERRDGVSP